MWVWQHPEWPNFVVDASGFSERVETFFRTVERLAGQVDALSDANGFSGGLSRKNYVSIGRIRETSVVNVHIRQLNMWW